MRFLRDGLIFAWKNIVRIRQAQPEGRQRGAHSTHQDVKGVPSLSSVFLCRAQTWIVEDKIYPWDNA